MLKQLEQKVKKVGDNTFSITPFPAFKAANLTGELASTLAPLLGAFAPLLGKALSSDQESGSSEGGLMDIDVNEAAKAISGCSEISGDKMETLMRKLLLGGHIVVEFENEDGKKQTEKLDSDLANELFCGDVQDMFVLCVYVIQLNFNGFFRRLAAQSGGAGSTGKKTRQIL